MIVPPSQPNPPDDYEDQEFDEDDEAEWGGEGEAPVDSPSEHVIDSWHLRRMKGGDDQNDDVGGEDELITIATFRTAAEAELAKTALDAEGIVAFIADA